MHESMGASGAACCAEGIDLTAEGIAPVAVGTTRAGSAKVRGPVGDGDDATDCSFRRPSRYRNCIF